MGETTMPYGDRLSQQDKEHFLEQQRQIHSRHQGMFCGCVTTMSELENLLAKSPTGSSDEALSPK